MSCPEGPPVSASQEESGDKNGEVQPQRVSLVIPWPKNRSRDPNQVCRPKWSRRGVTGLAAFWVWPPPGHPPGEITLRHREHGLAWHFDPVGEGTLSAWKKLMLMLDVSNRKKKNQGWKVFVQRARNFSRPALFAESSILGNVSKFCI